MCGESGKSRNGTVHHYYKCVSVKKKCTDCKKKAVRKQWLEDLVVTEVMKVVMDDKAIEAIASQAVDLQDRTITLDDVKRAIKKNNTGSDLDCHGAPTYELANVGFYPYWRVLFGPSENFV